MHTNRVNVLTIGRKMIQDQKANALSHILITIQERFYIFTVLKT